MTTTEKKTPAPGATGNEGSKSFDNGSITTAYLAYSGDNTQYTYGTWGKTDLPMKGHISIIIPLEVARKMSTHGPQLIGINPACVVAQSREARKQREEKRAQERAAKLNRLRGEVELTFADELEKLEALEYDLYEKINAQAQALLDAQGEDL